MTRTMSKPRSLRLGRSGHGISPHVTIALPAELLDALRRNAEAAQTTLSAHIRQALYRGLDAAPPAAPRREGA